MNLLDLGYRGIVASTVDLPGAGKALLVPNVVVSECALPLLV